MHRSGLPFLFDRQTLSEILHRCNRPILDQHPVVHPCYRWFQLLWRWRGTRYRYGLNVPLPHVLQPIDSFFPDPDPAPLAVFQPAGPYWRLHLVIDSPPSPGIIQKRRHLHAAFDVHYLPVEPQMTVKQFKQAFLRTEHTDPQQANHRKRQQFFYPQKEVKHPDTRGIQINQFTFIQGHP